MTTRFVRFNIKSFLEEYLFHDVSGEKQRCEELLSNFEVFYSNSTIDIQNQIINYLTSSDVVINNKKLVKALKNITGKVFNKLL